MAEKDFLQLSKPVITNFQFKVLLFLSLAVLTRKKLKYCSSLNPSTGINANIIWPFSPILNSSLQIHTSA